METNESLKIAQIQRAEEAIEQMVEQLQPCKREIGKDWNKSFSGAVCPLEEE
jgi:hypothetical protein